VLRFLESTNASLLIVACYATTACTTRLDFSSHKDEVGSSAGAAGSAGVGGQAGAANPPGAAGDGGASPNPAGELTFAEECEAPLDPARWSTEMRVGDATFRSWGGRADWMADENVTVAEGFCTITAERRATGDRQYTSGVMSGVGLFGQRYGRFEARLKAPLGSGLWPIFWLRALDGWPPAIDVAAFRGHDPTRLVAGLWYSAAGETHDASSEHSLDWSSAFHVYSVSWSEGGLTYAVDDTVWFESSEGIDTFQVPLYPVINLSISDGSDDVPPADDTTPLPAQLLVDWVRVYASP
jgi:beta-glucanase (GH16 family)